MAFIFGYSNLVVGNGGTSNNVNMTADWIMVDDGSGNTLRIPMTTTVAIDKNQAQTSTEALKRDEAGVANPTTWYSKWVHSGRYTTRLPTPWPAFSRSPPPPPRSHPATPTRHGSARCITTPAVILALSSKWEIAFPFQPWHVGRLFPVRHLLNWRSPQ